MRTFSSQRRLVPYANRSLLFRDRRESELTEELQLHLERETERLRAGGLSPDARGTAFVENTVRDILYAFRTFQRAPLVAVTIVATVALGLGLVAVAFMVLNALLFRVDAVPDVHEMFAVERPRTSDSERQAFTRAQFDALRRETGVFTDAYAEVPDVDSHVDGRLNRAAERALSTATMTLPACVASMRSKYTRSPAPSTTATAMAQLFVAASARAGAATFFAVARARGAPYGWGASGAMESSCQSEHRRCLKSAASVQPT